MQFAQIINEFCDSGNYIRRLLIVALIVVAAPAAAMEIRLDLHVGQPDPIGNWNIVGINTSSFNLIDYNTGLTTPVGVTTVGWNAVGGQEDWWTAGDAEWLQDVAADDGITDNGGESAAITFGGLTESAYRLELVVTRSQPNATADYTIGGLPADGNRNSTLGVDGDDFDAKIDGRDAENWLIWTGIAPTGGTITIDADFLFDGPESTGGVAVANAVRLSSVPLPASLPFLAAGLGLIGFLIRRRGLFA